MEAILGAIFSAFDRLKRRCIRKYWLKKLRKCGQGVYLGDGGRFTLENIEIGDDTYVGANCVFQSTYGIIKIGSHVMFGPGVHIHGGNHKMNEVGRYMKHASKKQMGDDGLVMIEDDCWIGANSIICSNVTVGRGSVVGAGSVVTKSVPPYSIYTGVPEKKIRRRFSDEQIITHEEKLYEQNR